MDLQTVEAADQLGLYLLGLPKSRLCAADFRDTPNLIDSRDIYELNVMSADTASMIAAYCRQLHLDGRVTTRPEAQDRVLELAVELECSYRVKDDEQSPH